MELLREIEKLNQARFDVGGLRQEDLAPSRYKWLGAEIELLLTRAAR